MEIARTIKLQDGNYSVSLYHKQDNRMERRIMTRSELQVIERQITSETQAREQAIQAEIARLRSAIAH